MRRVWLVGFEERTFAVFSSYKRASDYADLIDALPHSGEWSGVTVLSAVLNRPDIGIEDPEGDYIREALVFDHVAD